MVGWFDDEGLVSDSRAERVGGGERRQPALPADARARRGASAPTSWCCSISGASSTSRARSLPTSPGWASPGRAVPERFARAFAAVARRRATPRSRWCRARPAAGRDVRGWEVDRAAVRRAQRRRLRRPDPAPHRPQPRRVGARQRREHGRLRNARRSPPAAGHRLHDRARRLLSRLRRPLGNQHGRRTPTTRRSPGRCRPKFWLSL